MHALRNTLRCIVLLLLLLLTSPSAARPLPEPEPFSITGLWNDIKEGFQNFFLDGVGLGPYSKAGNTVSGTLSPSLMPDFIYFAEFSAAAYCDASHATPRKMTCTGKVCPTVQKNAVTVAYEFAEGLSDTTGIIAVDSTTKSIILSFRGSHSVRNWLVNLALERRSVPWCEGCTIHRGFYTAWLEEANGILSQLAKLTALHPKFRIVTTGHSLGGALAQIAATDLRIRGYKVTAYTYGSPRIGNDKTSRFISDSGTNYRITHLNDPVPRLPTFTSGYMHVTPEYHIVRDGAGAAGVNVVDGLLNFGGNTGEGGLVSLNIGAHLRYLTGTGIADCAPLALEIRSALEYDMEGVVEAW